jgi:hypothetical protein
MAKKDNLTVYQKLFTMFGNGNGPRTPKYTLDKDDLITTKSREEYEKQKLEGQQQNHMQAQWARVDSELYQKAVYYETSRIASYMDYEAMEFTPEISASLDIMSEESCTLNEQGKVITVRSESKRIKNILEDLFENILDVNTNLQMWTRNTCKYGDNFVYLKIDRTKGVLGASQLTNVEMERDEIGGMTPHTQVGEGEQVKKKEVKFKWKDKSMDFNAWEIAHFRLLGDDRKLPYGTSVLEKVRRIWKQLLLAEDAMLVYRVVRAPERRVFKVYVGNIDDKDVESYVQKVANKFKRTQKADNETGQVDLRYNTLAVDQDYFIPVRDMNTSSPIETLAGAQNLDQIADIQYIQRKMVTALRIPKPILGFEDAQGEGKNLALMDIRFARTVNRIQQAMIQELNKIAIIHLYILGFEEELNNFQLMLTNPSTQGEMLKIEQWKEKVLLYKDLVTAVDGIAPTSHTWAKKNIFNFSNDEITLDLEQQRVERAAAAELENTPNVIKKTGYFDKVDKLYGEIGEDVDTGEEGDEGDMEGGDDFGGGGGGSFGGGGDFGDADFGDEGDADFGDEGGDDFGGDEGDTGGGDDFGESFNKQSGIIDKLLNDGKRKNEDIKMLFEGVDEIIKKTEEKQ